MLTVLRIKNLALVSDLTLELEPGFQVITGETGAGKSVLLGALDLVLGARADRGAIRSGADQCVIEAVFDLRGVRAPIHAWLEENGLDPCEEGQLHLRRTVTGAGGNRQFINRSPASLAQLAQVGDWLVDFHGPHEHQSLLQPARQTAIADAFGGLESLRSQLLGAVQLRDGLRDRRARAAIDPDERQRQRDLLAYQVAEIERAALVPGEEERLVAEHDRARNAARLLELSQAALNGLEDGEGSVAEGMAAIGKALADLGRLDPSAPDLAGAHAGAAEILTDLTRTLRRYADGIELEPGRLAEIEERLDLIRSLRRKYGPTVEDVVAHGAESARRLGEMEGAEAAMGQLDAALAKADQDVESAAAALTAGRRRLLPRLRRAVDAELTVLGFPKDAFAIELATLPEIGPAGAEVVEFLFTPNPGEAPRPLRAIASSGELARVMLALKTVLAAQDEVPVLVFDEVDANIGGETAGVVAERLRDLSRQRQVLCITHLPQVAARADGHHRVAKERVGERMETSVVPLDRDGRLGEIARMLGGGEAARRHARALLSEPGPGSPSR